MINRRCMDYLLFCLRSAKNLSFSVCLKVFTLPDDLISEVRLFHNLGPTYDIVLKPRFVIWLGIFRLLYVLRVVWLCPTGWYISDKYTGAALLKKLYILVSIHCSNGRLLNFPYICAYFSKDSIALHLSNPLSNLSIHAEIT